MFAFDLERRAILLVGGDKSRSWARWYDINIPIADDRFSEHQAQLVKKKKPTNKKNQAKAQGKKRR